MARPTKYGEQTVTRLEAALRVGATYAAACGYAGISEDTLANWRRNKSDFSERLARAEGEATVRWLLLIEQAAATDWRAAAWKLERRYPREYGRNVTEVQGRASEPFNFTIAIDSDSRPVTNPRAIEAAERAYFAELDKPTAAAS
jgi:hypothetical protein